MMGNQEAYMSDADRTATIAQLNDELRAQAITGTTEGKILLTQGVMEMSFPELQDTLTAIAEFDEFDNNNDPYRQHDCGLVVVAGRDILWKIDYYDENLEYGSENPADRCMTTRVLTIMLAHEY